MKNIDSNTKVYIYGLVDLRNKNIRYVGWTSNIDKRIKQHIKDAKSGKKNHRCNWLRQLLSEELFPEIIIIEETVYSNREDREKYWISHYGRENLTNSTDGGEGSLGFEFSEESKSLLSKIRTGKKLSEGHRKAIANGKLGNKNPNYKGKATTEKTKEKRREKLVGQKRPNHSKKLQGKKRKGTSKYVGVTKRTLLLGFIKWEANININGKIIYIGLFSEEKDAAKAYDKKAIEVYGNKAKLNFTLDK